MWILFMHLFMANLFFELSLSEKYLNSFQNTALNTWSCKFICIFNLNFHGDIQSQSLKLAVTTEGGLEQHFDSK